MKNFLFLLFLFSFSLFSQETWEFYCSNNNESITVNATDVDNDGIINGNCDYLSAYILACSDNDEFMESLYPYFLEDLVGSGCSDFNPDWEIEIIDVSIDDNANDVNCEEGVLISVDGGVWQDEVSWTITDCEGADIIAEGGAPYADCVVLPDNYVIIMNDSWGDGWNENYMTIGNNLYTMEYGSENVIAVGDCDIDWWDGNNSDSNWDSEWNISNFTYECNGEIITVTFNDTANSVLDFNGDGIIDPSEILFYISENYDCDEDELNIVFDIWDDIIWNDSNWNLDTLDWNNDFDWDMNTDGLDDFIWDDFDWGSIWEDYVFSDIDWENTPWGVIIDLGINPEDLINYLIELGDGRISAFDWRDFIDHYNNSLPLELECSFLNERYIIQFINILGQNVDRDYKGIVFELYNDGDIVKKYISQ